MLLKKSPSSHIQTEVSNLRAGTSVGYSISDSRVSPASRRRRRLIELSKPGALLYEYIQQRRNCGPLRIRLYETQKVIPSHF